MRELLGCLCLVVPVGAETGWLPGPGSPGATTDLSVDTTRRNAVASFWHCVYGATGAAAAGMDWTGSYASCAAGTTGRGFQDDVQRRINFLRALAGLPAGALVNEGSTVHVDSVYRTPASTLRSVAAQQAAHMLARHRNASGQPVVTHTPASSFTCFTAAAGNACFRGCLAYGFCGPAAVDEYMRECDAAGLSVWSAVAGHRRWLLLPGATTFATGDTPGGSCGGTTYQPTNVLYCVPPAGELLALAPGFTAWPAPGYFPDELNTRVWSLSHPGADFSSARVAMTGPAGAVAVTLLDRTSTACGDPAIVWQVPAAVGACAVTADTVYQVTVSGIAGAGVPATRNYAVTLFDPDSLNESLALSGTAAPPVKGAWYGFKPVDLAEAHEAGVAEVVAAGWTEGAEDQPAPRVIDGTGANYALCAAVSYYGNYWRTGGKAFRLAFPQFVSPPAEDWFELDRVLVTGPSPKLNLHYRRGYSLGSQVVIETSIDDGLGWQAAGSPIPGRTDKYPDNAFTSLSVALPANQPAVRVRFRHDWTGGQFYVVGTDEAQPMGIFLDDLSVTGVSELQEVARVPLAGDAHKFRLDAAALGRQLAAGDEYRLRLRATLGGRVFPWGPTKVVGVTSAPLDGFAGWLAYDYPELAGGFGGDDDGDGEGNGVEYAFGTDPLAGGSAVGAVEVDPAVAVLRLRKELAELRSDVSYGAQASSDLTAWTSAGVTVRHADGELVAETPAGAGARFLRWMVTQK